MSFHINLLTLFPEMFPGYLEQSLAGRALERGDWSFDCVQIRNFGEGKHQTVDDTPFGGGAGMVMRADVIERALLSLEGSEGAGRKIYMSPRGKTLDQKLVKELSQEKTLTILCGRYEGVDQRVLDAHEFEEISIGDYVLSGGEPAALILMDACIRLLPGVMGNEATPDEESFSNGLLEYPHYTRPADWTDANGTSRAVPDVLKSGNHAEINKWRQGRSLEITQARRPDLLKVGASFLQKDTKTQSLPLKPKDIEDICKVIVDCAFQVHKEFGPGMLESIYEAYLYQKLMEKGLSVKKQLPIKINKAGLSFDLGVRADLIVEEKILIELKAVEHVLPVHKAQIVSYLKLTGYPIGFLMNFNTALFKDGIKRFAN